VKCRATIRETLSSADSRTPQARPLKRCLHDAGNASIPAASIKKISMPSQPRVIRNDERSVERVRSFNVTSSFGINALITPTEGLRTRSSTKKRSNAVPRDNSNAPVNKANIRKNRRANQPVECEVEVDTWPFKLRTDYDIYMMRDTSNVATLRQTVTHFSILSMSCQRNIHDSLA
jgi:hypothetical protein